MDNANHHQHVSQTKISSAILRRLTFVRYLFNIAEQQAKLPSPLSSSSILLLHDGVELFLHVAADYLDAGISTKSGTEFDKYFEAINQKLDAENRLSSQIAMKRLNTARVGLKHSGILISTEDILELRNSVMTFFELNTPLIFDQSIEDLSFLQLIRFVDTRACLAEAQQQLSELDVDNAMLSIVRAFETLLTEVEAEAKSVHGRSPFLFERDFRMLSEFFRHGARRNKYTDIQVRFEEELKDSVIELSRGMRILSMGLDYRKYAKFTLLSPPAVYARRNQEGTQRTPDEYTKNWPPTPGACRYCFDFVMESALRLQEIVFEKL